MSKHGNATSTTDGTVGRHPQYDVFADGYLEHATNSVYNAHYDRPACLRLLGDVANKTVLDAGCGPGLYSEELVRRGARVVGFDQSERMVELSRQLAPQGDFRVHDLADPLDWLDDKQFDLVLLALVLEHVDDRTATLAELRRVLKETGALVISFQHPTATWLSHGGSYFDTTLIEDKWSLGWDVQYWRTSLEQTSEEICDAGFLIERIVEPLPTEEVATIDTETYETLLSKPGFIAMRLVPR